MLYEQSCTGREERGGERRCGDGGDRLAISEDHGRHDERTYAQAAVQTREDRSEREKEKSPKLPAVKSEGWKGSENAVGLPHRLLYVEDMSDYEKEEEEAGTIAKAVVIHRVPTN